MPPSCCQAEALTDSKNNVVPMRFAMLVMPFDFMLCAPVLSLTSWIHTVLVFRSVARRAMDELRRYPRASATPRQT